MTLARYSNGASVIVDSSQISSYDIKETGSNASNISNGVVFTLSYKLVAASGFESSFPGILYVNNFKATIYTSSYDKIDNTGTISTSSSFYCPSFRKNVVSTQESASGSAYVSYPFQLKATDGGSFSDSLKISVGNNTINVYF